MAPKGRTEKAIERLRELEELSPISELHDELRGLLRHRSNHVVARAAKLAAEWKDESCCPDLADAFKHFMENPVKTDPGCGAKQEITNALLALGHNDPDVYLLGVRHVQMEPVFGGHEDTACGLRAASGRAVLLTHFPDAYQELTGLLTDREKETRRLTVQTLTEAGSREAELLLRMRARVGDDDMDTLAASLEGLMSIAPERSLAFVAAFLYRDDHTMMHAAALAIGQSHLPEAFAPLCEAYRASDFLLRHQLLLLPIGLLRSEDAFLFLVDRLKEEPSIAIECLEALALFAQDPDKRSAVEEAVLADGDDELNAAFIRAFSVE